MPRSRIVPGFVLSFAACAAPAPRDPPPPVARPTPEAPAPGIARVEMLDWLPRARPPQQGLGFVLLPTEDRRPALRALAPASTPTRLVVVQPGQRVPDLTAAPACVLGDFDGDGHDDVLGKYDGDLALFTIAGGGPTFFTRQAPLLDDGSDGPWLSGRACDWNGDGRADLAVARDHDVLVLTDTLGRTWAGFVLLTLPATAAPGLLVATGGDWDRDGLPDLVLSWPERGLCWCRNEGTRTAPRLGEPRPLWPPTPGLWLTALLLHDFDRDGWPDVIATTATAVAAPGAGQKDGFTVRLPRQDRNGIEEHELAVASRELDQLLQARRRAAIGFDGDAPIPPLPRAHGGVPTPMPEHERHLRDRIAALESRPLHLVAAPSRAWLRR